jgi:hypothetical protein
MLLLERLITPTATLARRYPGAGAVHPINGKFRDECLSLEWFRSRAEAKVVIEAWRRHYNAVRPHSSLGYLTPTEFAAKLRAQSATSAPARGRDAAVMGPARPGPLRHRPARDIRNQQRGCPSQANRGPKKQGRSTRAGASYEMARKSEELEIERRLS